MTNERKIHLVHQDSPDGQGPPWARPLCGPPWVEADGTPSWTGIDDPTVVTCKLCLRAMAVMS